MPDIVTRRFKGFDGSFNLRFLLRNNRRHNFRDWRFRVGRRSNFLRFSGFWGYFQLNNRKLLFLHFLRRSKSGRRLFS
jgi:hypothetical protein